MYGSYAIDNRTALDLQAGAAQHRYDGSRLNIDNSRSLSSFNSLQLSFGASLSRSYKLGEKSALIPSLALQYNQVALEACTETGAIIYYLAVQDAQDVRRSSHQEMPLNLRVNCWRALLHCLCFEIIFLRPRRLYK